MHATTGRYSSCARGVTATVFGLAILAAFASQAADIYVSANATPAAPYDTWAKALTNVQAALDYASDGDTVYLAGQAFTNAADGTKVYALTNRSNVSIRGGYKADPGEPLPGAQDPAQWPTALARGGVTKGRVLTLAGLTNVTIQAVTIRGGLLAANGMGGGIHVSASTGLVLDTCTISNNAALQGLGAGLYLTGGTLLLTNCVISGNLIARDANDSFNGRGAGIYINSPGILSVRETTIANNVAYGSNKNGSPPYTYGADGGGIYLSGGELDMASSVLTNNTATYQTYFGFARGGAIYNNNGKIRLRNVLIARNQTYLTSNNPSSGIFSEGASSHVVLENCTVADNDAGQPASVGLRRNAGVFAVTNSIVWGHVTDLFNLNLAHVADSDIGDGQNVGVQGCHAVDPKFADSLHYHLKSTAGHYTGGAFSGGSWTTAAVNSPLIDRGNPASACSREPDPNGGRVNMGAYGNTEVASLTPAVSATTPMVANTGAGFRSHTAANLRAELTDDGGQLPDIAFYYWEAGGAVTSTVPAGMREEGAITFPINGLSSGKTYEYRVSAANEAGMAWSEVAAFSTLPVNATIYVSSSGNNTDASTWSTAYPDALTAFAVAESGDTIRLAGENFAAAPGYLITYVYRLASKANLRIEGGYQATGATPGPRDSATWTTALARSTSAANARVLQLESLTNVTFEGVTIRDGHAVTGGGVYLSGAAGVVFENCRLVSNTSPQSDGGGLYLAGGTAVLSNSLVAYNQLVGAGSDNYNGRGGGIHVANTGVLTVRHSIIANNVVYGSDRYVDATYYGSDGGGIYIAAGGTLDLAHSFVTNNQTLQGFWKNGFTRGGGIANAGGTARLRNVLLARNVTVPTANHPSGGVYASGTTALESCTVAENDFAKTNNFGITNSIGLRFVSGVLAVTNTLVWGHTNDLSNFSTNSEGNLLNVSYSLAGVVSTGILQGVSGSVVGDPLFVGGGDYQVQGGSPAVNAGLNFPWMAGAADLAGQARIRGRTVDMGAYEAEAKGGGTLLLIR